MQLRLSPRQRQLLSGLFDGLSDKQIAARLRISVPTVRTHLQRMFSRFQVQDRLELILFVLSEFRRDKRPVSKRRSAASIRR